MNLSRRAFLIATGAAGLSRPAFGKAALPQRTWVIDENLPQSRVLIARARFADARIVSLSGDAGWLWFERLSFEAISMSQGLSGLTCSADAFVLTQLAAGIGMRATQHRLDAYAVLWTLER
ncbi:hypothetical protein [Caballeronia insecticola]|uniref:Uncharacterized protein n=1 Tax=Caballeronia insecticola TaxID=758793 RepID=R4WM22_9BURK|nr:hypothetical protein [Caballeronia insecticola]BAN25658.1 hypothetical protein BRPE64_BCDS09970 [Caballeronia insecticola]